MKVLCEIEDGFVLARMLPQRALCAKSKLKQGACKHVVELRSSGVIVHVIFHAKVRPEVPISSIKFWCVQRIQTDQKNQIDFLLTPAPAGVRAEYGALKLKPIAKKDRSVVVVFDRIPATNAKMRRKEKFMSPFERALLRKEQSISA